MLENIINNQRTYSDKFGLGYKNVHFEEGSSSMKKETKQKSYTKDIISPKPSNKKI